MIYICLSCCTFLMDCHNFLCKFVVYTCILFCYCLWLLFMNKILKFKHLFVCFISSKYFQWFLEIYQNGELSLVLEMFLAGSYNESCIGCENDIIVYVVLLFLMYFINLYVYIYIRSHPSWNEAFNPLRAKFFRGNINIYLHFVSFLHIDATQVVEILPQVKQEPTHST